LRPRARPEAEPEWAEALTPAASHCERVRVIAVWLGAGARARHRRDANDTPPLDRSTHGPAPLASACAAAIRTGPVRAARWEVANVCRRSSDTARSRAKMLLRLLEDCADHARR